MIIKSKNLLIKSVESTSESLNQQILLDEEIFNMTEVKQYPQNLPTELIFEILKDEAVIGELKLKSFRWFNKKAELSIFLLKEFRNKGYGTEALNSVISYGFDKLNLHRLEAEVIVFNKNSKKLIESFGFVLEGRLREAKYCNGKYFDILRYGLLKQEYKIKEL